MTESSRRSGVVVVAHREMTVRQIALEVLEAKGLEVHTTHEGEEAIRLVREHRPAVVLLSLNLMGLDGWHVAEALGGGENVLVALTADARTETRQRALEQGFASYLTLPVPPFELVEHLKQLGVVTSD